MRTCLVGSLRLVPVSKYENELNPTMIAAPEKFECVEPFTVVFVHYIDIATDQGVISTLVEADSFTTHRNWSGNKMTGSHRFFDVHLRDLSRRL